MKNNIKGQAAILMIFVIGMIGLLIGMTLSKTGFNESMMGRGTAGSTYAFYVANAGVEDAFYKIQKADEDDINNIPPYTLTVGEGQADINITGDMEHREITSIGKFENYIRKLHIAAYNTEFDPGFHRVIQAGNGGVELENTTYIEGDIYSNKYVKGAKRGPKEDCSVNSSTNIFGNVWAVEEITTLGETPSDDGPCIIGNAYAKQLEMCRVSGSVFYDTEEAEDDCPHQPKCLLEEDPDNCNASPEKIDLPTIKTKDIEEYLKTNAYYYKGDCVIDSHEEINDCWTEIDEVPTIGNVYITGNLEAKVPEFNVSGNIYVAGNVTIHNQQTISPDVGALGNSIFILSGGKISVSNNVDFTKEGNTFLLMATDYINEVDEICQNEDDVAINISNNVSSILFYAINDCVIVGTGAAGEFRGSVIGEGVRVMTNTKVYYDSDLEDAFFSLSEGGGWEISSFTEE